MKVAAVVPTCRGFKIPEYQSIDVEWYVVHDREEREVVGDATHIVAPDPELYGSRCDSIRSAGFLAAYQSGADFILTVDDDCIIPYKWAEQHVEELRSSEPLWNYTVPTMRTRGIPYQQTPMSVAIHHGLWDGVLDLDARTQEQNPDLTWTHPDRGGYRIHAPFPQSAMNIGFRAEVVSVMYQPAQGEGSPFDRFADIWGGLLAQRVLSHHGYAFRNGGAIVYHQRASDCQTNKIKEAPGMKCHEEFWRHVWDFNDYGSNIRSS
jgi:hypothetical protein